MGARNLARTIALVGIAGAVAVGLTTEAKPQNRVKWKMQSAFPSTLPHSGPSGLRFVDDIRVMSGRKFQIKFLEPGALVSTLECFDAASKGSVESCWTTPAYHAGKIPALMFFTTVPFGPQIGEFLAWKWFGGGNDLRERIYNDHGLTAVDCFCIGPETSGWFKQPIASLDELKGLKMRFFGLGAKVMRKLGVSTQLLTQADILPALQRGAIDATEYSMPNVDIKLGFHQIAKNNYYPGWHQGVSCQEFLMNKTVYEALPEAFKRMITVAGQAQVTYTYAETEAHNFGAMGVMKQKYGVTNRRWTDDQLAAFEKAWLEVLQEESARDPLFKEVADSYLAFRARYKLWGDAQALKATYQ